MKFKINYDVNKLLLDAKSLMKKLNFTKAYEVLKLPISQGLKHSDIYYLFGEVCRVLKKLEESEQYLLECIKYEQHSPFVFYSLGLLYEEQIDYKKSIWFFKHFVDVLETADAHYHLSKNYLNLNKNLKAAIHITKAIEKNKNSRDYYLFRAGVYDVMGFKELAEEDRELANLLVS
jgi:tetratricopeptide (TPR) repeat protein